MCTQCGTIIINSKNHNTNFLSHFGASSQKDFITCASLLPGKLTHRIILDKTNKLVDKLVKNMNVEASKITSWFAKRYENADHFYKYLMGSDLPTRHLEYSAFIKFVFYLKPDAIIPERKFLFGVFKNKKSKNIGEH